MNDSSLSSSRMASNSTYVAADSCIRLAAVQRLVGSWRDVDALLLILGVDSRSNETTRQLMNYLVFGLAGHQLTDMSLGFDDETMEDIMFLIGCDSVYVYCNPHNVASLLPVVANWRCLQLHCLQKDQFKDDDLAEDFKIRTFIQMTEGIKKIGVPYGATEGSFSPMMIEKWPLIQGYALDDYGTGGFFTMHHDVVDVADRLVPLYTTLDVPSMTYLITHILPTFEHHWNDLVAVVDIAGSDGIPALTENQIAEPFNVYFMHGQAQRSVRQEGSFSSLCPPRVLVGLNTCRAAMESAAKLSSSPPSKVVSTATTIGSAAHSGIATHMICDCSEPRGALSCTRTYFFLSGHCTLTTAETPTSDSQQLQHIYMACIDAVLEAINTYVRTHSAHESERSCVRKLRHGVSHRKLKLHKDILKSKHNVEFAMTASDYMGRSVELNDGQYYPLVKTIRLTVYDIPSVEHAGKLAGSVSFGESFMDSVILTQSDESDVSFSSEVIVLTSSIPRVTSWMAVGWECESRKKIADLLSESMLRDLTLLVVNNQFMRWLDGNLYLSDQAVAFEHSQLGFVYLRLEQLKRLQLYDGGSATDVALLIIEYKEDINHHLPTWIRQCSTLAVSILPNTATHRTFYRQFLPHLKSGELNGPVLEELTSIRAEYQEIYSQLCFHCAVLAAGSSATPMARAKDKFANMGRFINHLRASKSLHSTIVSDHDLPALVAEPPMLSANDHSAMPHFTHCTVTVLTGVPGSGKDQLAQTIVSWDKESTKWVVLRQPFDSCEDFDIESFQSSLMAITKRLGKKLSASMKRTRVLVITPGLTDVREVVSAILAHPEKSVKEMMKIGSVTACIDCQNCTMDSGLLFPNLLENCAIGLVNNIVWTGPQLVKDCFVLPTSGLKSSFRNSPQDIRQLITMCNPTASFIDSSQGNTLREEHMDLILSEDLFNKGLCVRNRLLFHGQAVFSPHRAVMPIKDFCLVCLKFHQPLDRKELASQLSVLKFGNKDDTNGEQPTVYHIKARVMFTDSSELSELEFVRQSGHLTVSPLAGGQTSVANGHGSKAVVPSESCFVFFGTNLSDGWLKHWLRGCRPKTELKKPHRTRKDLSSKEIEHIHSTHRHEPLPPGIFYNGSHYISMDGEKTDKHPLLNEFIGNFLKAENDKIDRHNKAIDEHGVGDMFD